MTCIHHIGVHFVLQQLIDALVREDIRNIILVLGHSHPEDINCPYSKDDGRTALHIAAALGNVVYVQLLLWVCYSFFPLAVKIHLSVLNSLTEVVRDGFVGYLCYFILIFTNSLDVCLIANYSFLQYNANVKVVDHEGRNALWYAKSSGSTECVELLMNNGCPEHPTLPRRRGSSAQAGKNDVFEKLPASVI